ncbi:MAG TPA: Wzz/FepE/Etk N-terminal domain-containing protein [Rubrobacteraceae bacterium]|nr:Wzz/FepE/Etk N-terminal domain-containing protein [Rubrobacteraceae bacterium]
MEYDDADYGNEWDLFVDGPFRVIWQRLWVIVLSVVVCVGVTLGYSFVQEPVYETSIKILVGQDRGIGTTPADAASLTDLNVTLSQLVATRPVVEGARERLGPQTPILGWPTAEPIPETQVIEVYYTDSDPERGQKVLNAIGDAFSDQVAAAGPTEGDITATVWERAALPTTPVSPNPVRNGLLALAVGCLLGLGLAFLLEYLDNSWRSPEEAERISRVPMLGAVPDFQPRRRRKRRSSVAHAPDK